MLILVWLSAIATAPDVIPHIAHHGHGHGISSRYFRKAQGHGYGLGYGGYGLGYGGYGGYGYGGLGGYGYGGLGGYGGFGYGYDAYL
ncbi:hypothetical protein HNY73_002559 [Argiope bruennichi]|uniref:Uncharacterized protein n=1 Tax=Argiope bruennichi TaxID=94029 RepID=A0A8T0FWM0_ARGBR|nr:hypothetical protein HNY73_002559 [Argiope bruennichi]